MGQAGQEVAHGGHISGEVVATDAVASVGDVRDGEQRVECLRFLRLLRRDDHAARDIAGDQQRRHAQRAHRCAPVRRFVFDVFQHLRAYLSLGDRPGLQFCF